MKFLLSVLFSCAFLFAFAQGSSKIKLYFNHEVDTTFKRDQIALNVGNKMVDTLISYINQCDSTLDIAIYNSFSANATSGLAGAINDAFNRGVKIRVIYDGGTSSTMVGLLNNGIPRIASPTTSAYTIMHHKFVVFDAKYSNAGAKPMVWTGSTNWTSAQINGPDKNHSILIEDRPLALAYTTEFEEMWGSSTQTFNPLNSKFGPYKTDNTPHTFNVDGILIESYFSPSDGTNANIINALNTANVDIDAATMLITKDDLASTLISRYNNGVEVNVVIDNEDPNGTDFYTLQTAIGSQRIKKCVLSGQMHHKFAVIDNFAPDSDPQVITGSHNWTASADSKNDENTLIIHDANIANQFYQAFAYLYGASGGQFKPNLSTDELQLDEHISVYPNPVDETLFFLQSLPNWNKEIPYQLLDLSGKTIQSSVFENTPIQQLEVSSIRKGTYFLVLNFDGKQKTLKVLKH
jgi:phosphatidylserine/phosphatidylglycerophosphate/cardiolipin synthase-like enzyme